MDSYMEMFIFETTQLSEKLESILLESEEKQSLSQENINEIFRIMHTIKGSSAMMSLNDISNIAHILEDLFSYIRQEKPVIDVSDICDKVFKVLDYIRFEIEHLGNEDIQNPGHSLAETIKAYLNDIKSGKGTEPKKILRPIEQVISPKGKGTLYKVTVFFDDFCSMLSVRAFMVINKLKEMGEIVSYFPEELDGSDNCIRYLMENGLEIVFTSGVPSEKLREMIEEITDVKTAVVQVKDAEEVVSTAAVEAVQETETKVAETLEVTSVAQTENTALQKEDSKHNVKQNIISVNISKLDKLINIVGEIVISESMVINSPDLDGRSLENFSKSAMQLRKLTEELQDLVLSVRMIPIELIFSKMHRIVRDMSKKLEKEVVLEVIGEETEVDKNVLDNLSDPLMHLIRNSMDHGVETKEERLKSGKNPVSKITLEAKNTGGEVIITVKDDGRGLDKEKILKKARENGLTGKNENPTEQEIYNFILLPGFSTKDKVTEFSGRGVGMDVVKQNVEKIGGSILVSSEQGKGMAITIRLPLTLAIIDGMTVKISNHTYIIPTQAIIQCIKPAKGSVFSDTQGKDMILVEGKCYAVTKLHKLFNIEPQITDYSEGVIIMTEYYGNIVCLFADALLGQQPVVVKSLPEYLSRFDTKSAGIGGCTILGDGSISLILDIAEIVNK